jgi:hypothetical protein
MTNQKDTSEKIEEIMKKTTTDGFVNKIKVEINEVMFLKEAKEYQSMVIDTGCPQSMVGQLWLEKYLKSMNLTKNQLESRTHSQKFQFGSSKVFEALRDAKSSH